MIQRIQTLFLVAAAVFTGLLLIVPSLSFEINGAFLSVNALYASIINASGSVEQIPASLLMLTVSFAFLMSISAIFFYKKRPLQKRFTNLATVLTLLIYGAIGYYFFKLKNIEGMNFDPAGSYGLIFPLISVILLQMAASRIQKDENLIKSIDRIR